MGDPDRGGKGVAVWKSRQLFAEYIGMEGKIDEILVN